MRAICEQARGAIEIVHNGNERSALTALEACRAAGRLGDFIIGTDAPAGSGVQPNGMLRMVTLMASLGACRRSRRSASRPAMSPASGQLDGGRIAVGQPADFVFLDKPQHSSGKDVLEAMALGDIPASAWL